MTNVREAQTKVADPMRRLPSRPGSPDVASSGRRKDGVAAPPPSSGRAATTPRSAGVRSVITADCRRDRRAARSGQRRDDSGDVLVGHRRRQQRQAAGAEERPELVERGGQRSRAGGVVRPVEEHVPAIDVDELEPARPSGVGVAVPAGGVRDVGDPRGREGVEEGVGDRDVGRLVATAQPDPRPPEAGQLDEQPVAIDGEDRRRLDDRERHAEPSGAPADDRSGLANGTRHGQIAALDDRRLLAGDEGDRRAEPVGVVEIDVRDRRDAAVPGMGRIEPASEPDLHQREIDAFVREPAEHDRGQELELRRIPESVGHAVGGRQCSPDETSEGDRVDRPAPDLEALPVRHEMRLRGFARTQAGRTKRGTGEGEDAALAVRPGDEGTADPELWIPELAQERPGPSEPELDPETAPFGESRDRGMVGRPRAWIVGSIGGGGGPCRRSAVSRAGHSRLRSSS
jgi:hypothetical protein